MIEYITCFKEFPLEVKADCAIKLQLEAYLGQEYKCDVSSKTHLLREDMYFWNGSDTKLVI